MKIFKCIFLVGILLLAGDAYAVQKKYSKSKTEKNSKESKASDTKVKYSRYKTIKNVSQKSESKSKKITYAKNPSKTKRSVANPLATSAGINAVAPGKTSRGISFRMHSLTIKKPGSEMPGVPASEQ